MTTSLVVGSLKAPHINGLIRFLSLVFGIAVLLQCDSNSGSLTDAPIRDCTSPDCNVSLVTVSPATATVFEGLSVQFRATARDASGQIVTGVTFQWEVSDSAVAEIDASGRLTGKAAGQIQVRAIANGKVGSAELVVIDATVASLEIAAQPSLLVNETALLTVTVRNAAGAEVPTPPQLQWTSSDEAIARVSDGGRTAVVTALRRGTVTINVSTGSVVASLSLSVNARMAIGRPPMPFNLGGVAMAIGEALQFEAFFVDVNGVRIDDTPSVTWASGNTDVASVSSTGLVTSLQTGSAMITATSSDGAATLNVTVTDVIAGLPARVRLANAADGYDQLTFVPSQGVPVTLAFGESVEVPIVSGTFGVQVDQLVFTIPGGTHVAWDSWLIRGGDHLEVFATRLAISGAWITEASVPADMGRVRFVQGGSAPVVLLGAPGAEVAESRLLNCYLDWGYFTEYVGVPAGEFDVIAGEKDLLSNPLHQIGRVRGTVVPGRAVTYVLIGGEYSPQPMRLLAFPEF